MAGTGKRGPKPKLKSETRPPERCTFEEKGERCTNTKGHKSPFCVQHTVPARTVGEMVEKQTLGEEATARLREELKVDQIGQDSAAKAVAPPPQNADAEAWALVQAALGQAPAEPAPQRASSGPSADIQAHELVLAEVRRQQELLETRKEGRQRKGSMNISPTAAAAMSVSMHFPEMPDLSAMVDSEGKSLVKPGYTGRWIRETDSAGKPSGRRLQEFRLKLGAEDVLDEKGQPLTGVLGKAVQYTNAARARWIIHKAPSGAFDSAAKQAEMAFIAADQVNSQIGRKVVDIIPTSEHGSKSLL